MLWLVALVPALALLYYWLIGAPILGRGATVGRVGVIPRTIADYLTQFHQTRVFPAEEGSPSGPVAAVATTRPTEYDAHGQPVDWTGLIRSMRARIEEALGEGFSAECDGYSIVLTHGTSTRRVGLVPALQPPPADETDRATRACLKILEEAQGFRVHELDQRWPVREREPGGPETQPSLAVPRAPYEDGMLHPGYRDDLGVVLALAPIPWPNGEESG